METDLDLNVVAKARSATLRPQLWIEASDGDGVPREEG
jgi:hypothetical protein